MAIVVIGIGVGAIGSVVAGGVAVFSGIENRKMQKEFLSQQAESKKEDKKLIELMLVQGQQRQTQMAGFLSQSGYGDIANLMTGGATGGNNSTFLQGMPRQ